MSWRIVLKFVHHGYSLDLSHAHSDDKNPRFSAPKIKRPISCIVCVIKMLSESGQLSGLWPIWRGSFRPFVPRAPASDDRRLLIHTRASRTLSFPFMTGSDVISPHDVYPSDRRPVVGTTKLLALLVRR